MRVGVTVLQDSHVAVGLVVVHACELSYQMPQEEQCFASRRRNRPSVVETAAKIDVEVYKVARLCVAGVRVAK